MDHFALKIWYLIENSRYHEAAELFDTLQQIATPSADFLLAGVHANLACGQHSQATLLADQISKNTPENIELLTKLATLLNQAGEAKKAYALLQHCITKHPHQPFTYRNLVAFLIEHRKYRQAISIIRNQPMHIQQDTGLQYLYGEALSCIDHFLEAQQVFEKLLQQGFETAQLRINLGRACEALNQLEMAKTHLTVAIVLAPQNPIAYMNLGVVCKELQQLTEAYQHLSEALRINPNYHTARWNLAHLYLLNRSYPEGFKLFESRFAKTDPVIASSPSPAPLWDGSNPAAKHILVVTEQAYGDTIQFIRYLPLLSALGATILLFTQQSALIPLLQQLPAIHHITTDPNLPPACDWQIPLLSLPHLLGTAWETVPAQTPYLSAPPDKIAYWQNKLAHERRYKIGIAWQGRPKPDPRRSIATDYLQPLLQTSDCAFISLQTENPANFTSPNLQDYTHELSDFSDTAALMHCMDLVVSIDSAVAHLAGALGRPLWVLLPYAPDWRWHLGCNDSPWYPTARLFRQPRPDAWETVLYEVSDALHKLLSNHPKSDHEIAA